MRLLLLGEHLVDHAVGEGFLGGEPVVAVGVFLHLLEGLSAVEGDDFVELFFELYYLADGDFHVGGLSVGTAHGLVDHDAGVGECRAAPFLAGAEEDRGHGGGEAGADGGHLGLDELHGVVDAEAGVDGAAGGVEVDGNLAVGIHVLEEEELRLDDVGGVVVDGGAEEDDAVHHQAAEDVHLGDVELALFDDVGGERGVDGRGVLGEGGAADATVSGGVFFEFCHIVVDMLIR